MSGCGARWRRSRSSDIPDCWWCRPTPIRTSSQPRSARVRPVLLIHGDQDDLIPAQALFACLQRTGLARRAGRVAHLARHRPRHRPGGPAPRRRVPGAPHPSGIPLTATAVVCRRARESKWIAETFALIVGGGPVGLSASIELSGAGCPTSWSPRSWRPRSIPKCNNTNARSMEHFRRLGIADALRSEGSAARHRARVRLRDAFLRPRVRPAAAPVFGLADAGDSQQRLADRARARAATAAPKAAPGAQVHFGWRLTSFAAHDDHVVAEIEDTQTGERHSASSRAICSASTAPAARCAARSDSA